MGIVFRQSVKTTIVTFAGAGLGALILWMSSMYLQQAEYGLVVNISQLAAIVQLFIILGTANLVLVYTQRYAYEDERRKALLTISLLTTTVFGLVFTVLFLLLKKQVVGMYNAEDQVLVSRYYYYVPAVVYLMAVVTILDQYLMANLKIAQSAFSREVVLRLVNIGLLCLLFFSVLSFSDYLIGYVLSFLVPLVLLFIMASRTKGFGLTLNLRVFSRAEYKDMLHFAWYHLLVGSTLTLLNFIDTLMLAPLDAGGMKASAIYAVAVYISTFMFMPYRAMANASMPILNQAYIDEDMHKVKDLFSRAGVNILIVGMGMFAVIGVNLDNAVSLLGDGYGEVKYLVPVLMLGKLADMATGLNNELISISKFYKFNFRVSMILLVVVVVLDRIFIPQYGMMGAAWVATCTLTAFNIAKMIFLHQKLGVQPFTNKTWRVPVAGFVAIGAGYVLPYLVNPYVDAAARSGVVLLAYLLALTWLKPSADLSAYLATMKKDKKLF